MTTTATFARIGIGLAAAAIASGCATKNPQDPLEGYNRAAFGFNEAVDTVVLKPVATAYREGLPDIVQTGVGNFFGNIGDVWTAVNNLLQGHVEEGMSDVARVTINTMFGILGLIDVASDAGLPKHKEDFGQTLGTWGVDSGPYFVIPFLGPSTVRDTAALPVDTIGDPWSYVDPSNVRYIGLGTRIVDQRAAALGASELLEDAALDKYEFVRDAFLQRRESMIRNGKPARGQARQQQNDDDWVTVANGHEKPSGANAANQSDAPAGVPTDAAARGSAARAIYMYGIRPR